MVADRKQCHQGENLSSWWHIVCVTFAYEETNILRNIINRENKIKEYYILAKVLIGSRFLK